MADPSVWEPTAVDDAWLTRKEVATRLKIDRRAVGRLVTEGRLRVRPLPARARFNAADVERLAEAQSQQETP